MINTEMMERVYCPACGSSDIIQVLATLLTKCTSCGFFGHVDVFVARTTIVLKNKRRSDSQYYFDTLTWSYRKKAKVRPPKPTDEDYQRAFSGME